MPAVAIAANCDVDVLREHHQVAHLAGAVAHVVGQQRLGLEAQRPEHPDERRLVGDDVDHELREPELDRLETARRASSRPMPRPR